MCHGAAIAAFPTPGRSSGFVAEVEGYRFGDGRGKKVAILPDIYGCTEFYRGLSTMLVERGADVWLVDTFAGLGDLPESTREAAFTRRNKVRDLDFVDRFEGFVKGNGIQSVIGFCLGGLYVFELARRSLNVDLVGLYGFPQGLPNSDPLAVPFDYLHAVGQPFTMLLGANDESVGVANIAQLKAVAPDVPAMKLTVYDNVGHNFLPLLDSADAGERAVASDALDKIIQVSS